VFGRGVGDGVGEQQGPEAVALPVLVDELEEAEFFRAVGLGAGETGSATSRSVTATSIARIGILVLEDVLFEDRLLKPSICHLRFRTASLGKYFRF